ERGRECLARRAVARTHQYVDVGKVDARAFEAFADIELLVRRCAHCVYPFEVGEVKRLCNSPARRMNRCFLIRGMRPAQLRVSTEHRFIRRPPERRKVRVFGRATKTRADTLRWVSHVGNGRAPITQP